MLTREAKRDGDVVYLAEHAVDDADMETCLRPILETMHHYSNTTLQGADGPIPAAPLDRVRDRAAKDGDGKDPAASIALTSM